LNGVFDPAEAGLGAHVITYTIEDVCGPQTCQFTITVTEEPITCEDAVISNFPDADDVCEGEAYAIDFSDVVIENAVEQIWTINPVNAGEIVNSIFNLDIGYVGNVTITLVAVAEEPCEDAQASLSFAVYPLPIVEITGELEFCEGESTVLTATAGVSYLWSSDETTQSITVTESGIYSVVVTDENGCEGFAEVMVVVHPLPDVEITGDLEFCEGGSTVLTATEGVSYLWSTGETTQSITVTTADLFSVTVTDENGCEGYDEVTTSFLPVTIPECPPNMIVQITDAPFLLEGAMPESGTFTGDGVSDNTFDPSEAGTGVHVITYTIDDICGEQSCQFTITVTGESFILCVGDQIAEPNTTSCSYIHSGTDWDPIYEDNCVTNPILSTFDTDDEGWTRHIPHDPNSSISWFATGGNPDGYIRYNEPGQGALDYFSAPALFLGNKSGFYGGVLSYDMRLNTTANASTIERVILTGGGASVYFTSPYPTTTWQTFEIPLVAGDWKVAGSGVAASEEQIRTVLSDLTSLLIFADWRIGPEQVSLDNVLMTPGPAYYVLSGATEGTGYSLDGVEFSQGETTVTWYFTDSCGNLESCSFTVTMPEFEVAIAADGPTEFCEGEAVVLTATEGATYLWSTDETSQSITVSEEGLYSVTVTDENGCEGYAEIIITVYPLFCRMSRSQVILNSAKAGQLSSLLLKVFPIFGVPVKKPKVSP
jgi:large repetitive protein